MTLPLSRSGRSRRVRWTASSLPGGFTLVELMIALVISLLILLGLVTLFVNMSRNTTELKKANEMIENGRFAMQALTSEIEHAGYWGGYVPQFDNLVYDGVPLDGPTAIPDPCAAYGPIATPAWTTPYVLNLIAVPIQTTETLPAGAGCLSPLAKRAGTDVVVVRRLEECETGVGACDAAVAGRLYMQSSRCQLEQFAGMPISATAGTVELDANAAAGHPTTGPESVNKYKGTMIRIVGGTGMGQVRWITVYNDATRVATIAPDWTITPDSTSTYAFDYVLGTAAFPLHARACVGTGTPAVQPLTDGPLAPKQRFMSTIFYVSDYANPDRPGDVIPTLVRSSFEFAGGTNAHQAPVPLVSGVERFRVELGIDNLSDTGAAVDYTVARLWANPAIFDTPTNRGDGYPDTYIHCSAATPCTATDYANAVVAKLFVLIRSRDRTPGFTDNKTYCLGTLNLDGTCPAAAQVAAANDDYQRHLFTTTVRLVNISGRRETP